MQEMKITWYLKIEISISEIEEIKLCFYNILNNNIDLNKKV